MQNFKNPIFQKRHYEFVADILKELKNNICVDTTGRALVLGLDKSDIVEIFADKFTKISPKNDDGKPLFDKQKFLDRIGIK